MAVQSVYSTEESGKTTNLLSDGILAYIDSTVPYIILPPSACEEFENAFGLEYDDASGLYLVSDTLHTSLQSRDANFTFVLSNTISGGSTISITLPYAAFDLSVSSPHVNNTSKYFPLKRGNDTTYTLGRTFLQEALVSALGIVTSLTLLSDILLLITSVKTSPSRNVFGTRMQSKILALSIR